MLALDPRRRISARDAMTHPYFADVAASATDAGDI